MPRGASSALVAVCIAAIPLSPAFAQHCQPYWTAAYRCMNGCGGCPANRGNPAPYIPPPPTPEQIAAQHAYALNEEGLTAFNAGNWGAAEISFKKALEETPGDIHVLRNLAVLQSKQGESEYKQGNYTAALAHFQQALSNYPSNYPSSGSDLQILRDDLSAAQTKVEEAQQAEAQHERDKIAAANMQQSIQTLAQSLSSAPSSDGLDFQGASRTGTFGTTSNPAHPGLDFSAGPGPRRVHSVAEQLSSAAKSGAAAARRKGLELAKAESNCAFDTSTCAKPDSLSTNSARSIGQTPGAAALTAHLASAARKDPQIQQSMAYYQKLDSRKIGTEQKLTAIERKIKSHDGDTKVLKAQQVTLTNELANYRAEETKTEGQIKKRTIAIHVPWIESPAPAAGK